MAPKPTRHTLARPLSVVGVGLHSGHHVRTTIAPAPAGQGLVFVRTDMPAHQGRIPALWTHATPATLCTRLLNAYGASVATIEHLMAALHALAITDATISVDSAEIPILDGSARPWVDHLLHAGLRDLGVPAPLLRVHRPVEVRNGTAWARLRPNPGRGLALTCAIDFATPAIGVQSYTHRLTSAGFAQQLAPARTFCMDRDIRAMHAQGLALGGSVDRAVIFRDTGPINPEGLRFANEPVRHKMLDAIGDLYLAGGLWEAAFEANRPGHALTGALLAQAFATPGAIEAAAPGLLTARAA